MTRPGELDALRREDEALERLEDLLGAVLTAGVALSAALLAAGLGVRVFAGPGRAGTALLGAGLLVLMATPMVRVLVALGEYIRFRDWFFASMTAGVLLVLLTSVAIALSH